MELNGDVSHPRPDFARSHAWQSLNGGWDFAPDPDDRGREDDWQERDRGQWTHRITVPFPWEAPLSGISRHWLPVGWYRRSIARPATWADQRTILHIGAAFYASQVWLNGRHLGEHEGGYLPFSFDITDALNDGRGELVVRVDAPLDKLTIPHGKQHSRPPDDYDGCCFTPSSGIWQPVWLEARPATYIDQVDLRPTFDLSAISARIRIAGPNRSGATLTISVDDELVQTLPVTTDDITTTIITLNDPVLWSPANPHLYPIILRLTSAAGEDQVATYTGLRRIETCGDRLFLNGEPLYLRGALDQGFWPDGIYAAPSEAALRQDVELALAAGYNVIRKHIKFEDPRWLAWADRLGLLVWAEPPCTGRYSPAAITRFEAQLAPWVGRDGNHPSIILWGLYNEEWGLDWRSSEDPERQAAVVRAYDLLKALDPSRPIIDDSGWWHVKTDVLDWHYYDHDLNRWNSVTTSLAADQNAWFGHGIGPDRWYETQLSVPGRDHAGLPLINGEYASGATPRERGWHLRWQTQELRRHLRHTGYIYTELYDIEHELCGIYTDKRELNDLGCDPATINAETVVIFDLMPDRPGADLIAPDSAVEIDARIAHHGTKPIVGTLEWGWDPTISAGQESIVVAPWSVTNPISIRCSLPVNTPSARLTVWLRDEHGQRRASGFIDVVRG